MSGVEPWQAAGFEQRPLWPEDLATQQSYPLRSKLYLTLREFPKIGVPYFGVLITRILLFRVLYWGPLLSETP